MSLFNILINDLPENTHGMLSCCDELKLRGIVNLLDIRIRVQKNVNGQK